MQSSSIENRFFKHIYQNKISEKLVQMYYCKISGLKGVKTRLIILSCILKRSEKLAFECNRRITIDTVPK